MAQPVGGLPELLFPWASEQQGKRVDSRARSIRDIGQLDRHRAEGMGSIPGRADADDQEMRSLQTVEGLSLDSRHDAEITRYGLGGYCPSMQMQKRTVR